MIRLWLFGLVAALALGSARPPLAENPAPVQLPYVVPDCVAAVAYSCNPVSSAPVAKAPESVAVAAAPPSSANKEPPEQVAAEPVEQADGVAVLISLSAQKAYVFRDGELIDTSPVSTGKRGHRTPVGTFPILQKKVHHRSSKYDYAPMPYMQRLTSYGIALHAGALPGYPASHGCIRLPRTFAKKLYGLTDLGTRVTITREEPESDEEALTLL